MSFQQKVNKERNESVQELKEVDFWRRAVVSRWTLLSQMFRTPQSVVHTRSRPNEPEHNRHAKRRRACAHVVSAPGAGLTSSSSSRSNTRLAFFLLCRTCSAVALGSTRGFFPALGPGSLFLVRFVSGTAARFLAGGAMFVLV